MNRIILDLCGGTGSWSKPYKDAGYDVRLVTLPDDIRLVQYIGKVHGVLAATPCDHLAGSGARWWASKGKSALLDALSISDACLRFITFGKPEWWAIENPVGRLSRFYGKPDFTFQPYEFGDPYQKRTCLWGKFNIPKRNLVEPTEGQKIWRMGPSPKRKEMRSITPQGFAKAFFEANQ